MIKQLKLVALLTISMIGVSILSGCPAPKDETKEVVIYTSVDLVYAEPILQKFEQETGIKVLPVYDVEASKTTGLVNRLIAEMDNPQADVWWNGEFAQTLMLRERGVLAPYESPSSANIPEKYRDPDGYWYGLTGRARVIIINTDLVAEEDYPDSIMDFLDPGQSPERMGIAMPLFGTTATHAAALYAVNGPEEGRSFFDSIHERGVQILSGNSTVRDMVVSGQLMFGLTDTDDACASMKRGDPVTAIFPDQEEGGLGTLVIPGTVAMVEGGPNPEEAKELIEFLLSGEVEGLLIESGWSHVSLRGGEIEQDCFDTSGLRSMEASLDEIYIQMQISSTELNEIFTQ